MRRAAGLLLTAAALTAVAGARPASALLPAAAGLALLTAGAWAATTIARRRVVVTRSVPVREAREDEAIRLRFELAGLGRLPVTVEVDTGADGWKPLAARGGSVELVVGRRGAHRLGPSPLRVRDALGVFERRLRAGRPEPLLILPAPHAEVVMAAPASAAGDADEPDGLQPYTPGTPLARIHWATVARGAGMHVRRLAAASDGLPLVVVDTAGTPGPTALDWVARAAAGCIQQLLGRGGCRVLLPGDRTAAAITDAAAWRAVHRRLALIEPSSGPTASGGQGEPAIRIGPATAPANGRAAVLPPGVEPAAGGWTSNA